LGRISNGILMKNKKRWGISGIRRSLV